MKHASLLLALAWALVLLPLSCAGLSAKRPAFRNTKWIHQEETFVADAGTMTETTCLEFGPGKEVLIRESWVLPAHPAMYMNADGTMDVIPESSSEHVSKGRWKYSFGKLTITLEDGTRMVFRHKGEALIIQGSDGSPVEYKKQ